MKKRIISSLLIMFLIIGTAACGSFGHSKENRKTNDDAYKVWDIDFNEEPTTVTLLTIGDKPTNGMTEEAVAEINKILLKRVNAKLDIFYVGWDDYLHRYNEIISSKNSNIDLIGTGSDWLDAWPNARQGNFLPMSREMLQFFCPETYSRVTSAEWDKCSYDGKIYFIPENEYTQWTNHGFIYRADVAREAGYDKLQSWDDITGYFSYIVRKKPEMIAWDSDGTNTIIGLGYLMSQKKYNPIYEVTTYGLWGAYSDGDGKIVSPYYEGDEFIKFAKLMKEWDMIGVWRAGQKGAGDEIDEFYQGYSAVVQHHTAQYYNVIEPLLRVKNPSASAGFYWFGEENANLMKTSILHGAMAVSAYSKNPEKALMVYDVLRNDRTCYRLMRYGVEGMQYVSPDGKKMEKPRGYNADRDDITTNFWWGRRDDYELLDTELNWNDYYKLLDSYEHVAVDYPWDGYDFAYGLDQNKLQAVIEVCDKYIPEITYARYSIPPEAEVTLFRDALKEAGIEDITRQLQKIKDTH